MWWIDFIPLLVIAFQLACGKSIGAVSGRPTWPAGRWTVVVDRRDEPALFWTSIVIQLLALAFFYALVWLR